MNITKQLLMSSAYWVLNKQAVQIFGLEAAFLLSSMVEAETMMADKDGWFYQTTETVETITTLSRHKQDQCIKQLEDLGVITKDIRGLPAKRYFKINYECLTNKFVENSQTRVLETDKLVCQKSTTNKEHINKELNHKESIKKNSASNNAQPTLLNSNDITVKDKNTPNKTDLINAFFEEVWSLYPIKKGKGSIKATKKKEIYKLGDEFKRCINRYVEDTEQQRKEFKELKFKNGSTFFNSGYVDYLDKNYEGVVKGEFSRCRTSNGDREIKKVDLSHLTETKPITEREREETERWFEENDLM